MYLPGTPGEIIGDLRTARGLSKKQLSEITGIVPSQLSRIENGKIKNISSDILIELARALNVSTDYILGLTTIKEPKNHDISELGLSNGAVKTILSGNIDMDVLNCLIEHERFPYLLYLIKSYFSDSITAGIVSRNEIIDLAAAELSDFYKKTDKDKSEIKKDIKALKAQKIGQHEAESEKIKNTFLTVLRDIKKSISSGTKTDPVTSEQFKQIKDELKDKPANEVTADTIAGVVTGMLGQAVQIDDEKLKKLQGSVKELLEVLGEK